MNITILHRCRGVSGFSGLFVLLATCLCLVESRRVLPPKNVRTCQKITVEDCRAVLGYNQTNMPNIFGHEDQREAEMIYRSYLVVASTQCSPHTSLFLCSAFIPMCNEKVQQLIGPCQPLCNTVKNDCRSFFEQMGFNWPEALNCSKFVPRNTISSMCIMPKNIPVKEQQYEPRSNPRPYRKKRKDVHTAKSHPQCNQVYKNGNEYIFTKNYKNVSNCIPKCSSDILWSKNDKIAMDIWLSIWTSISLLASLITVVTFLLDPRRYEYPARTVIYIGFCNLIVTVAYVIRLLAGRNLASCGNLVGANSGQILIQDGLQSTTCSVVFLLKYYFSCAAYIWWTIMGFCFMLKYCLRWSTEAIDKKSQFFHLVVWCVPAAQTIVILVIRDVGADELTGICQVASLTKETPMGFVIVPLIVYSSVGLLCFSISAISHRLLKPTEPQANSNTGNNNSGLRTAMFGVMHAVSMVCVLGSEAYNHTNRLKWRLANAETAPSLEIAFLKQFMILIVGAGCGIYATSQDSLILWRKFCYRAICYNRHKNSSSSAMNPMTHLGNARIYHNYRPQPQEIAASSMGEHGHFLPVQTSAHSHDHDLSKCSHTVI